MKAILLAAGLGTRLQPLTHTIPKCLVPIQGKPLLAIWLDNLIATGFSEILINTHYLAEQVVRFVETSPHQNAITLVHEPALLGTLGTLKANQTFWQQEEVLIAHADNLCLCDWQSFLSAFKQRPKNCLGTLMLFNTDVPQVCGIVELDQRNLVQAFHEKVKNPPSNLANAAIYLFDQTLVEHIALLEQQADDISLHLIPTLMGQLNAWVNQGYLRDIGSLEQLQKANADMERLLKN